MPTPSTTQVARARQQSLLLDRRQPRTCAEIATWFGAMQAQDAASGKWSLGVRIEGATEGTIDDALERGEVLRTWPMRGTIHIVPSVDARWMLELTGRRVLDASGTRRSQLGLDLATVETAAELLDAALSDRVRLTRAQALEVLRDSGIATDGQRGYYLLWWAAHTGRICIGPSAGKDQTFVRLSDWAPRQTALDRTSALVELTYRYFRSHGPAPVSDFAGWSGLTLTDARAGVAANEGRLRSVTVEGQTAWASSEIVDQLADGAFRSPSPVVVLPGFDEFMLGYKDRRIQVPEGDLSQIVPGNNGMFRATVCRDGRAIGTWSRTIGRSQVAITVEPFEDLAPTASRAVRRAFDTYGQFVGLPVKVD